MKITEPVETPRLILRDMRESDVEDYVRWFTTETEWGDWDAPWEGHFDGTAEEERRSWTECFEAVQGLPADAFRRKFEIELDGRHVGWICSYTDLGYLENPEGIPAIGLDIPDPADRGRGCGLLAFRLYTDYLRGRGHRSFFTQTWSGNLRMTRLAEKLGFREVCRRKGFREVRGKRYDAVTYRLDV